MQLRVTIPGYPLLALIDSGSTHSSQLEFTSAKGLHVAIVTGDHIHGSYHGLDSFTVNLILTPLVGFDMVLGVNWLNSFGPILLDFSALNLQFLLHDCPSVVEYCCIRSLARQKFLFAGLHSSFLICIEDVTRAIHLKSFDYRVLNLLLCQLRGEKVNEMHMEFLSISELLVEVSDDLFDYEDDVVENNFNILRMFVKYYGASAAPIMTAKFITEAEEKYDQLSKALDPELSMKYQQRCEEATKEGGKICGPSLGTWHIPPENQESLVRMGLSFFKDSKTPFSAAQRRPLTE
ncbi:hypothetical protein PHJA_002470800 [Phtheirospermum japonicum]|uniref:Uncharacterized protein n=1 Tax=Phtheirospermum japonicum TaxID=374723 RepID=A0A830CWA0_9LAMI|nr:hypothetical protein PHJA_002470800 [Phtheirospermum japonicum]